MRRFFISAVVAGILLSSAALFVAFNAGVYRGGRTSAGGGESAVVASSGGKGELATARERAGASEIIPFKVVADGSDDLSDKNVRILAAVPDGEGGVYFAYHNKGDLKVGRWPGKGATFEYQVVDSGINGLPLNVALGLGRDGRPHVIYRRSSGTEVQYAVWDGAAWSRGSVSLPHNAPWVFGLGVSLALDRNGEAHICYCWQESRRKKHELKYAYSTGGAWEREVVDSGLPFSSPSLAFDDAGRPHVAYFDEGRGDLKYASREGGRWEIETVETLGWVGAGAALTFNRAGAPCISYYELGPIPEDYFNLKVARRRGGKWEVATALRAEFISGTFVGPKTALTVDRRGRPEIFYVELTKGVKQHYKLAKLVRGRWPAADKEKKIRFVESAKKPEITKWEAEGGLSLSCPKILYAEPDAKSPVVFESEEDAPFEVLEAVSILGYKFEPGGGYEAWFKVRRNGAVGWSNKIRANGSPLVEFRQRYSPVREAPSEAAPVIKHVSHEGEEGPGYALKAAVPAGSFYDLKSVYNGWYCVGNFSDAAWVPADAPGVTAYGLVFRLGLLPHDYGEVFSFYFPLHGAVDRVVVKAEHFLLWERLSVEDPILKIATADEEFVLYPEFVSAKDYFRGWYDYFVAPLPRPVRRDEITAVTFETGVPARRFRTTVDPREAWGEAGNR